jgi:hypothetical protein
MATEMLDVQYARSGDVAIAYQVVGEGPLDVVFVRGTLADLLAAWDQPLFVDPEASGRPTIRGPLTTTNGGASSARSASGGVTGSTCRSGLCNWPPPGG